jgi:hypothetical protein
MTFRQEVRKPEIIKRIAELVTAGNPFTEIARILEEEKGIKASKQVIERVYNTYAARRAEVVESNKEMEEFMKEDVINVKKQLWDVNKKCREILDEAIDPDEKLKAIDRIHSQIMIQQKLLENLNRDKPTEINIVHITTKVLNIMKEWEDQGVIEIKSPEKFKKLKQIYGEKKDA